MRRSRTPVPTPAETENDDRVSLVPLTFEEALKGLLDAGREDDGEKAESSDT